MCLQAMQSFDIAQAVTGVPESLIFLGGGQKRSTLKGALLVSDVEGQVQGLYMVLKHHNSCSPSLP